MGVLDMTDLSRTTLTCRRSQAFWWSRANARFSATDELNSSPGGAQAAVVGAERGNLGGQPIAKQRDLANPLAAGGADEIIGVAGRQADLEGGDEAAGGERLLEQHAAADGDAQPLLRRLVGRQVVVEARAAVRIEAA